MDLIICLVLAVVSLAAVLIYVILMVRGKAHDDLLPGLAGDSEKWSNPELIAPGLALVQTPFFSIDGPVGQLSGIRRQAQLLYPEKEGKYALYWATIYLANTYSNALIGAAFVLCLLPFLVYMVGLLYGLGATLLFLIVLEVLFIRDGITKLKIRLKQRTEACEDEFPNMVSKLILLLNAGMTLDEAWFEIAKGEGALYSLMRVSCDEITKLNVPFGGALYKFADRCDSQVVRKFIGILSQAQKNSGAALILFLQSQMDELWSEKRTRMMQKGDAAAAGLLLPIMIVLVAVIVLVLYAAVGGMNLSF